MNKFRCNEELLCMNYVKMRFHARNTCIITTLFALFYISIEDVPVVTVNTSGFNSRADSDSKM